MGKIVQPYVANIRRIRQILFPLTKFAQRFIRFRQTYRWVSQIVHGAVKERVVALLTAYEIRAAVNYFKAVLLWCIVTFEEKIAL